MNGISGYRRHRALLVAVWLLAQAALSTPGARKAADAYRATIEADWAAQEQRKGRAMDAPAAASDAYAAAQRLIDSLRSMPDGPRLDAESAKLGGLRRMIERVDSLDSPGRLDLYLEARWIARNAALKNPLFASKPIVFMKRRRFICQMLHEYIGYYYDYADIAGGGVYVLTEPGRSFEIRDLIAGRLPKGNYTTLALSYDAKTIYFAFAERARKKYDYYSPERRFFQIYCMKTDGSDLRRLSRLNDDSFDPCPLPDGGIAFVSTRRGGFIRCNNPWEPLPTHTLHRMDASGGNVRTLSFHETSEWHPAVLNDGRIAYCRWDYVDRSAANYHGIWLSNPDGTSPVSLFGNYTRRINACFQPRAIPGSNRIAFIAGAHHADVGGSLVVVDPARTRLDPLTGQDEFDSIEVLTPEVCFPEAPGWPGSYFHSPWPLSEDYFLVAFSFEPLPGMGSGVKKDTHTGLYYFDRFGNLELLYRDRDISCMYPIPLAERPVPPAIPSTLDPNLGEMGEFVLSDVYKSHFPLPASRRIRELRIFQVLPKTHNHIVNQPRIGHANAESARMMLGTVPVERDGSAYFRAPAGKPLYFQAVDQHGRAVQSMRSVTYLQGGERRGCIGCHEQSCSSPVNRKALLATRRPPSEIEPGPDGTMPFSYPRLVQPVLDRHCIRCHDGRDGPNKSKLVLTGEPAGTFSKSYQNLKPFVKWYEWGGASITQLVTRPGRIGADESPLTDILDDQVHAGHVRLPEEDRQRLNIWLDGNVPFYGTYGKEQQLAQKAGKAVSPPLLQ